MDQDTAGDCCGQTPSLEAGDLWIEKIVIDPRGDLTIIIEDANSGKTKKFLVSSQVLKLASPVLEKMLSSNFVEGIAFREQADPSITLFEDDIEAMNCIFRAIHHDYDRIPPRLEPDMLALVAIQCDKYDFVHAMKPWAAVWYHRSKPWKSSRIDDCGYWMLAAHMFQTEEISLIAVDIAKMLPLGFEKYFEGNEILQRVPSSFISSMSKLIQETLDKLHFELQDTEDRLRAWEDEHEIGGWTCPSCGRSLPEQARMCHPCRTRDLLRKKCTSESRLLKFLPLLREFNLWPSVEVFKSCSVESIMDRFNRLRLSTQTKCLAKEQCPIAREMRDLVERANTAIMEMKKSPELMHTQHPSTEGYGKHGGLTVENDMHTRQQGEQCTPS